MQVKHQHQDLLPGSTVLMPCKDHHFPPTNLQVCQKNKSCELLKQENKGTRKEEEEECARHVTEEDNRTCKIYKPHTQNSDREAVPRDG